MYTKHGLHRQLFHPDSATLETCPSFSFRVNFVLNTVVMRQSDTRSLMHG